MSVTLSPTQHQVVVNPNTSVVTVTAPGPVGPQGGAGAQGPAGAAGAAGAAGPAGADGVITSVAVTGTDGVQVDSGSPITTSSGTITLGINKSTLLSHINVADGAEVNVNGDWNASSGDAQIQNKPTIPSGNQIIDWTASGAGTIHASNYTNTTYSVQDGELSQNNFTNDDHTKLNGIATGAEVNVQADWNQSTNTHDAYIANKPTIPSGNQIIDWTSSGAGTIHATNIPVVALTSVQEANSQSAQLGLTTQEGDVVVRTDENKSYVRNSGTAGDMNDFTLLRTPTDAVLSVNGSTGAITLTHDGFGDFVANEHIDWTTDQGSTNIHAGNYTAGTAEADVVALAVAL